MKPRSLSRPSLRLCLASAVLLLAACGGGSGEAPPPAPGAPADTTGPVITITDSVADAVATGDVVFTFNFNEDVGTSFTADDVTVTGGTKGTFTRVSGTRATLVAVPTPNSTGSLQISVAANAALDARGNGNTATSSQQAYETAVRTQMSLPVSFDAADIGYGLVGFGGAEASSIVTDPTDAANKVAKVVRAAAAETYAGTTVTDTRAGVQLGFAPKIPFNTTDTRMSVRVWSPDAGIPVRLKVEDSSDPNKSVETEATVTTAAGWQTLTFDFMNQATGTSALNLAFNYNKATIFFDFGRAKAQAVEKTYYFDDLAFVPGAGGGGGGGGGGSCGTTEPTCAPTTVVPAGSTVIYSDATVLAGVDTLPNWGQSPPVIGSEPTLAGNKSLKYVFGGTALYQGIDWSSTPQDVSGKTTLHLDFFSPDITSVKVSIISAGKENAVTRAVTAGSWNAIDIDLALYTVPDKTAIIQIKLEPNVAGTLYVDNIYFHGGAGGGGGGCGTTDPTCAPTTSIPAGSTVIYSDAAAIGGLDTLPNWGQSPPVIGTEPTLAGNKSLKYVFGGTALYQGIDWSSTPQDVSGKTTLHLDFFSPDITSVKVSIISAGKENAVTRAVTAGSWNAIDIDLALYTVPDKTAIIQIKLEPNVAGTLYVDNIYFHGSAGGGGGGCGTTEPTCAPATSIPAGSNVIYSDAASIAGLDAFPVWGQSPPVVGSEPVIAGNKSLKYTFGALYQGIDWSGSPQDVSGKATLHLDVWSANVASVKVSLIGGGSENGITKTLTAGGWNSLDIDLSLYTSPDKTKIIQIKLEPNVAGTIYVDNIYFHGTAAGGGGGGTGTFTGGIFSSDYSGNLGAGTAKSDKGGNVGFFYDPRLFAVKVFEDGSVCGSACNPGGIFNFYYGIGKPATPTYADAYFGAFVNAPGNTSADASAYSKLKLKFWGDAESWEKPNFTAQVDVLLQGPTNAACTNPSGRPEITKAVAAQKIGAGSDYTIPKTDFVLTASCGGAYTVDSVWSAVGAVVVRLTGSSNLNYVNLTNSTPPSYPTFINVGPISFIN